MREPEWKRLLSDCNAMLARVKAAANGGIKSLPQVNALLAQYRILKARMLQAKQDHQDDTDRQKIRVAAKGMRALEVKGMTGGYGALKGSDFDDFGEFLRGVMHGQDPRLRVFDDRTGEVKAMAEAVGATGGFLVPDQFRADLQGAIIEASQILQRTTRVPMARRQLNLPAADMTSVPGGGMVGWFMGLKAYWGAEGGDKTDKDAEIRLIELVAHKLYGYLKSSNELIEDSALSLETLLAGPLGWGGLLAWVMDDVIFRGTGVGQPRGILNAAGTINVARDVPGAISWADLVRVRESLWPAAAKDAVWLFGPSTMTEVLAIVPAGTTTLALPDIPEKILGCQVLEFGDIAEPLGSRGDVTLASWRHYIVGDRKAISLESDKGYGLFASDQTQFRSVMRVDGQPILEAALTGRDGATEYSPFVMLDGSTET